MEKMDLPFRTFLWVTCLVFVPSPLSIHLLLALASQ